MHGFVERHQLWSDEQRARGAEISALLDAGSAKVVRLVWADHHGLLRGKTLVAAAARDALYEGVNLSSTLLFKDTSHRTVVPVFAKMQAEDGSPRGGSDFTIVPDPTTFRMLPWAPGTGWIQCDAYLPDGRCCPFDTRRILRRALAQAGEQGYELVAGLEVEFHAFRLDDPSLGLSQSGQPGDPPAVSLLGHGYQYLTELRYDQVDGMMELLRGHLLELGLPLRSLEVEFGPSQFELVFGPSAGLAPADTMVLLRGAVKQICRRHGLHATFMCRPRIPNVMSSGWHLHQSLRHLRDGSNAFVPATQRLPLSEVGMHYLGGLKAHACASAALASPSINGYRRYRPNSLAPDRASWACDNRGAMLRVLGGAGQSATRIENRIGEPTANPYLYLASQLFSGLDGMRRRVDPGPSADAPYEEASEVLPRSLHDALGCLRRDSMLNEQLGSDFVAHYCHIKEAEIARFNLEVSEWEQREYFDIF